MDCGGPHCAPCRLPLLLTLEIRKAGKAVADDVFFQVPPAVRRPPTANCRSLHHGVPRSFHAATTVVCFTAGADMTVRAARSWVWT